MRFSDGFIGWLLMAAVGFVLPSGGWSDELLGRRPGFAFQEAIDAAYARGGGRVTVPRGRHVTGGLVLRSNVELHLAHGAVLEGSSRTNDYPVVELPYSEGAWMAVVMAVGATNVAVTGEGEIFGNGTAFPVPPSGGGNQEGWRPRGLFFGNCRTVRLEGFRLRDAACWGCVVQCCEDVTIRRLAIDSHANRNNDGIDIEARNVLIADCDIDVGDDAVCLKSNNPDFVVENVVVSNVVARSHCANLKLGTASHGTMRNVLFTHCRIEASRRDFQYAPPGQGPRPFFFRDWCVRDFPASRPEESASFSAIAIECVDGGAVEDVTCSHIEIDGGTYVPIFVRAGRRLSRANGTPRGVQNRLKCVRIEHVRGRSLSAVPSSITGIGGFRVEDVTLRDVHLTVRGGGENAAERMRPVPEHEGRTPSAGMFVLPLPAYGLWARHVTGLTLDDVSFELEPGTFDRRACIVREDVR